jgi:hypothetical protein
MIDCKKKRIILELDAGLISELYKRLYFATDNQNNSRMYTRKFSQTVKRLVCRLINKLYRDTGKYRAIHILQKATVNNRAKSRFDFRITQMTILYNG